MAEQTTISTVWRLMLDEQSAQKGQEGVESLAESAGKLGEEIEKIARQKKLQVIAEDFGKMAIETGKAEDAALGLNKRLQELGASEDEIKGLAKTFSDVSEAKPSGGKGLPAVAKFRGAASLLGGSELGNLVGIVDDIQDAAEGMGALRAATEGVGAASAATTPGLLGSAAGFAAVLAPLLPLALAIGAVVAVLAVVKSSDDQRAKDLKEQAELERSISDEIAAGATREDIEAQIEALRFRAELEKTTLEEGKKKYDDYIESIRNAAGGLGRLLEPIVRLFGGEENQLAANVEESQKIIDDAAKKEAAYNAALEKGLTAKNDAKKHEEDLADARDKAARETEKAADEQKKAAEKVKADQEKAAAERERAAEQVHQKEQQIAQKRHDIARQYGDKLVDIARKSAEDATKATQAARLKEIDNRRAFDQDIADLSIDFQEGEREEALKRQEDEAADLRGHASKLQQIRDDAFSEEKDLLNRRDFLGATRVAERANQQMEAENKAFKEGQDEKLAALKAEDDRQLRELDKARRERLLALQRANAEAKIQYQRDMENQRDARRVAMREAGIDHQRQQREASEQARALLGIKQQQGKLELDIARQVLQGIQSMASGSVTNNNQRTWNGDMTISTTGASSSNLTTAMLKTLSQVGLT